MKWIKIVLAVVLLLSIMVLPVRADSDCETACANMMTDAKVLVWPVANSDIQDRSISMKKIKGITRSNQRLRARLKAVEARLDAAGL